MAYIIRRGETPDSWSCWKHSFRNRAHREYCCPCLGAEQIIDTMVAVNRLSDAEKCIKPLRSIGYEYVPEYEESISERRYFHKGQPPKENHYHLHMVARASSKVL